MPEYPTVTVAELPDAPNPTRVKKETDEPARVIAVGAPNSTDGAVISEPCPDCDDRTDRTHEERDGAYLLFCADCGARTDRLVAGSDDADATDTDV